MPSYYVYAPFFGTARGRYCYPGGTCDCCALGEGQCGNCGCRTHVAGASLCCPADIFGADGAQVRLYASSNILSVRTVYTGFCRSTPPPNSAWVNRGVKVELYCGSNARTGSYIGTVLYGHLMNRNVVNGQIYNGDQVNGLLIGSLSNVWCSCSSCPGGACDGCACDQCGQTCNCTCSCCCYPTSTLGHHVHMGRSAANGFTNNWTCGTPVSIAFWIYRFDVGPVGSCY